MYQYKNPEVCWNDDVDAGINTGAFLVFYMEGLVEHTTNLPDPVALSSAEAEYNEACLACMSMAHQHKFLYELELVKKIDSTDIKPVPVMIDNRSAVDWGVSYKGMKHTHHIMRCYHYIYRKELKVNSTS